MAMTSRERLVATLNHRQPDQVCVDFCSTHVTGIAASTLAAYRRTVFDDPGHRVKVHEPYQMLGHLDEAMMEHLGVDVAPVMGRQTMFGFPVGDWKPFTLFDGTEVLVPGGFNVTADERGGWLIYPEGDTSAPPRGRMPKGGYYFDAIVEQAPIDDDALDPEDNLEEFGPISDADLQHLAEAAARAAAQGRGAVLSAPGTAFGDIGRIPATALKRPRGIRDVQEWYLSLALRPDYIRAVFEKQCAIALANLERLIAAIGDDVQVVFTSGTDFGTQTGLFSSVETYRDLFKPFHKTLNDYIHAHSNWKVFIHSCGAIVDLIPDLIEAGFDILNPVQCSARGMDPQTLKREFGRDLVFWGGGVDTQKTFPFGTPEEVYREVRERIDIFNDGGGYVFNTIHNIQARTPVANMEAMMRALRDSRMG